MIRQGITTGDRANTSPILLSQPSIGFEGVANRSVVNPHRLLSQYVSLFIGECFMTGNNPCIMNRHDSAKNPCWLQVMILTKESCHWVFVVFGYGKFSLL